MVPSVLLVGLFGGYLVGVLRVEAVLDGGLLTRVGERVEVELVITGPVRASNDWQSAAARVTHLDGKDGLDEPVWFEIPPADEGTPDKYGTPIRQGMVLRCRGKLIAPKGESDSGYNQERQLLQQGIVVVLRADSAGSIADLGQRGGAAGWFDRLRAGARRHLSSGPDQRVNEVLEGVVLGDTAGIDKEWLESFRRAGTAHMLCVSGLHVASLAAIVMGFARLLGTPRGVGFLLAGSAAVLMIPFVGPSPPIIRAAVMVVVVLLGRWLGRGRDQWQVLALAAVVLLTMNPFAVFDVGFQLSFSALAGILALLGPLQRFLGRLPPAVAGNIAVSLAASLGTAPVALAQFGRISLVGPLANILVVPALPILVGLGMGTVALGFVWSGLGTCLSTLASIPMTWTILVSRLMGHAPVLMAGDLGRALVAVGAALASLPAALAVTGRRVTLPLGMTLPFFKRTVRWLLVHRPRRRGKALLLSGVLVVLGSVLGWSLYFVGASGVEAARTAWAGREWPDAVEVRVLDIGQGNAVLVRTPQRHTMLFDGGPADCQLAEQLRSLGVDRLDVVVISHPHADHFAGLLEATDELQVGMFLDHVQMVAATQQDSTCSLASRVDGGEALDYLEMRRLVAESGAEYVLARGGSTLQMDGVMVRLLAPARPLIMSEGADPWGARGSVPSGEELNSASLVAVVSVDEVDVLVPGDAEARALAAYDLPEVEVLVVPHHGSGDAVTAGFLAKLRPRAAVISSGKGNTFGHPHPETVSLLQQHVGSVVRTDTVGWVSFTAKGDRLSITTERTESPVSEKTRQPLKPAYLILGDDSPKVEYALKRLKTRVVEDSGSDASICEFDAGVDEASVVVGSANTLDFLGGTRLVLVRAVHSWLKAQKEEVTAYLRAPAPSTCLTLVAEKLPAKDLLRVATAEHGEVLEYPAPKHAQLPQWLMKEASSRSGAELGINEARLLVQRCGDDQNLLLREVEKLQTYAGDRRISEDDVLLLGTPTLEASIFELLDSLALGRAAAAFQAASELLAAGERTETLFNRILRNFQNMSRVSAMKAEGMRAEAIQGELKMKPYPVRKLMEQADRLGPAGIARRLAVLADTDARMKGMGTLPNEVELQLCLGRLLSA